MCHIQVEIARTMLGLPEQPHKFSCRHDLVNCWYEDIFQNTSVQVEIAICQTEVPAMLLVAMAGLDELVATYVVA